MFVCLSNFWCLFVNMSVCVVCMFVYVLVFMFVLCDVCYLLFIAIVCAYVYARK